MNRPQSESNVTMFSLYKLFVIFFIIISVIKSAFTTSSRAYIDTKLKEVKDQLAKSYVRPTTFPEENKISDYKGKWIRFWTEAPKLIRPRSIDFSDQTFLFNGNQVFSIPSNVDTDNDNRIVNELNLSAEKGPIKFVKTFFWNRCTFALFCQVYSCTHYLGLDISNLEKEQTIEYQLLLPVDATFFIQEDLVYLIISYKNDNYLTNDVAPSKIYQWTGKYMNFIGQIFTPTVKALTTFHDDESTVLLLAFENNVIDGLDEKVSCIIFELANITNPEFVSYVPNTSPVTSIYPYRSDGEEFAILVSDNNSSGIFWWDGNELKKWINIPEIASSSLLYVMNINNETLLFVYNPNVLHIYRVTFQECTKLNDLNLKSKETIVEIKAWKYESSIILMLIRQNLDNTYQADLWRLELQQVQSEIVEPNEIWNCFEELEQLLNSRMPIIQNLRNNWSKLLPVTNNVSVSIPLQLPSLFMNGGNISLLEFHNKEKLTFSSPMDIQNELTKLEVELDAMDIASANILPNEKISFLSGKVVVNENAYFKELYIDNLNVESFNNLKIETKDTLISQINQNFSQPLKAKIIYLDNLEISSLCGINKNNWLYINDVEKIEFSNIYKNNALIVNNTIFIDEDIKLKELNAETLNGENLRNFLDDIFILNSKQIIKGNITYQGLVHANKLTVDTINNVSSSSLITKYTNQTLGDVFIDTLHVQHLYLETFNGVPINKAARMSQENVIKGKVTVNNLLVTDELIIHENISFPYLHPTQIYDEILINGNIFVKNLVIEAQASLVIGEDKKNIYDILENSWRKSKNQSIENSVVFEKGALIDELFCEYLNGIGKKDFLDRNTEEIDGLENIVFSKFHFSNVISASSGIVKSFLEESPNSITFLKPVRLSNLTVDNFSMDNYNGIPIQFIMQPNDTLKFSGITNFEAVHIDGQMIVNDIRFNNLNLRVASAFENALRCDDDLQVNTLRTSTLSAINLQVKKLCGKNLEEALIAQKNLNNQSINIEINNEVQIENNLQIKKINGQEASNYIDTFRYADSVDFIDFSSIKNLHITGNLNVNFLNGRNVQEIFSEALSRTKKQLLSEEFIVTNANIKYLTANIINKKNLSNLMFTDEPCTFYGNTSFGELFIFGNTLTKTLQGEEVSKLRSKLQYLPLNNAISLNVVGNISWERSSLNLHSMDYLLNNAVTKNENQYINSPVTFEKPVTIDSFYLKNDSRILQKIGKIVSDTVIDDQSLGSILVKGSKIFNAGMVVNDLEVTNNIDIENINGLNFEEVASQIFQKYNNETVASEVTFLGHVEIGHLNTNRKIHGVPLYELATKNKMMPKHLHFNHLTVKTNSTLHKLDGVDFDNFKRNRVTIHEDQEIFGDVKFSRTVTVLNDSFVSFINGIRPTNLVVNSNLIPNVIHGTKTFMSKLDVEGNVEATTINNLNTTFMYENSLLNNDNINITGNLIFENNVENLGGITVSGKVNGLKPQIIVAVQSEQERLAANLLNERESFIEHLITNSANSSSTLTGHVFYLEKDERLRLHLPGVQGVRSMQMGSSTQLDVYTSEAAALCGLQSDCFCRGQYTVDILASGNYTIQKRSVSNVTFDIYYPKGLFAIKIESEAVSSGEHCSKNSNEPEISKIFWTTFNNRAKTNIQKSAIEVSGFIADAQIFVINDRLYLMVAIFYDKTKRSHATESVVYEFKLQSQKANLIQNITTDGAKKIHIFQITDVGIYALIGCVKGKSESLVLRFDTKTRQFQQIRSFATGGSKHIASVSRSDKTFIILNNPDIEALQIFVYNPLFDNFYEYQNLYFQSRVTSLNVFYSEDFGHSEAFVVTTTKDGWFYIYEYMLLGKFQLKISYWIQDIQVLAPFRHMDKNYLFAGSKLNSTVFSVIQ